MRQKEHPNLGRSWITTERGYISVNIQDRHLSDVLFKTRSCKTAFGVLSRNRKTFAVSSLILNSFASQVGQFFLPHSVVVIDTYTPI